MDAAGSACGVKNRTRMAFTEGFISELVGRRATIDNRPIGKVADFLVAKPDAVFPLVDGLVIKSRSSKVSVS